MLTAKAGALPSRTRFVRCTPQGSYGFDFVAFKKL